MKSFLKKGVINIFLPILFTSISYISATGISYGAGDGAKLIILFIVDGLRPDLISREDTPNIYKLMEEGVFFENSHAVFPTVTRVNAAAIATASWPDHSGVVSNSMFIAAMDSTSSFSTGDYRQLYKLNKLTDGKLLLNKTWAQLLAESNLKPAAISSGSTGSTFLLNHQALNRTGILINGWFEPDSVVAFPKKINDEILRQFGPAPDVSHSPDYNEKVNWTTRIITDYLLTKEKPDVIYCWITEPDHTQHGTGIGAPTTMETIRNSDRNIGLIIQKIKELGLYSNTDILITSDHGFSTYNYSINMENELIKAGLKRARNSGDIVLASSGQSVLLHVKNRERKKIKEIVSFFQQQNWIDAIFTAGEGPAPLHFSGWVDGTFSLELIHMPVSGRGPDILITFPWTSQKNKYGYPGTDYSNSGGKTGPRSGISAGHGSMSPWTIRNTMIAWGVDFKSGVKSRVPAANIDFTATILALKGIPINDDMQGRVLREAVKGGTDIEKIPVESKILTVEHDGQKIVIQISMVGQHWYVDKSWRTTLK